MSLTKKSEMFIRTWRAAVVQTHLHRHAGQAGVCWMSPTSTSTTARLTRLKQQQSKIKVRIVAGLCPLHPLSGSPGARCHRGHWCSRSSRQGEIWKYGNTRSLGPRWAPTSSWRPFGPAFCPSGILDFVLRALRALRPCDPRTDAGVGNIR